MGLDQEGGRAEATPAMPVPGIVSFA